MSDSLMPFQPLIDEPSNILPSSNSAGSTMFAGKVTCCWTPRMSTKRRSTNSTLWSLISFSTFSSDIGYGLWLAKDCCIVEQAPCQPCLRCKLLIRKAPGDDAGPDRTEMVQKM